MTDLHELQEEVWEIAENHGFHMKECSCGKNDACDNCGGENDTRSRGTILALIHSEVSEALEADRESNEEEYAEELADIVIRVLDHAESEGIDLENEITRKNEKNRQRDYKHGKEY